MFCSTNVHTMQLRNFALNVPTFFDERSTATVSAPLSLSQTAVSRPLCWAASGGVIVLIMDTG
jgi:hypothetical protein